MGVFEQRRHLGIRQIRDGSEVGGRRCGEALGGGVALDEFEDPAGGEILGAQGEFGEGQGEQVVELVEEARALADNSLEPTGHRTQSTQFE